MMELKFKIKDFRFGKVRFDLRQNCLVLSYFAIFRFF